MNNPIELNILLSGDLRKQIDQVGHSEVQTFRKRSSFILYSTTWQGGVALGILVFHYVIIIHIILLFKVRKDSVIARLLYTGATIRLVENHIQTQTSCWRHCHLFMVKRQKKILESLKSVPKEDMEEKILDLQRIDAFWSLWRLIFPFSREGC